MPPVLVATERGITAIAEDGEARAELDGRNVRALAQGPGGVWAIADGTALLRREDDGSWVEVAETGDAELKAVLPVPGGVLAGTADTHLLRVLDGQVAPVEGFDAVEGRETWHAVGSSEPYVRSLTMTADSRALLASVHVGGIPRSGNGGSTWKPTIDPEADVHEVRADPVDPKLVLAAAAVGLCVSDDAGATWNVTTDGLHSTYCRAVAITADGALVSASDGPFSKRGAVYRWPRSGGPLERCADGLPEWLAGNVDTRCIDATRDLVAMADEGGTVFTSPDGGRTWHHLADLGTWPASVVIAPG